MLKPTYYCDQCGKAKDDSNHWWMRNPSFKTDCTFIAFPWNPDSGAVEHICSETCLVKALSKWMETIKNAG